MDLSIAIVSWNTKRLLDECLESVFENTGGLDIEVIVVDNASSDESLEMVRSKYQTVIVIANNANVGFAKANNQAYAVSSGKYFLLLNSDTLCLPESLGNMVEYMDGNTDVGVAGPLLLNADGSLQPSWARFPTVWSEAVGYHDRRVDGDDPSLLSVDELRALAPFEVGWVGGACFMVRRTVAEAVGLLDEGFFMYSEEADWCWRITRMGHRVALVPSANVIHYGGASSKMAPLITLVRMEYSRTRMLWRMSAINKCLCFPFVLLLTAKLAARYVRYYVLHKLRFVSEERS